MIPAINASLQGLHAAERRLQNSANNIANLSTTGRVQNGVRLSEPFTPQSVQQVSLPNGGVQTVTSPVSPKTNPVYNPDDPGADENGITQLPNVSLEGELVNQKIATYDYKANLVALKVSGDTLKNLLDIVA